MPRFAANLTLMFNEVPFLDRFEAAAKAGFTAVEFLFPYAHPVEAIGKRLHGNDLTQACVLQKAALNPSWTAGGLFPPRDKIGRAHV